MKMSHKFSKANCFLIFFFFFFYGQNLGQNSSKQLCYGTGDKSLIADSTEQISAHSKKDIETRLINKMQPKELSFLCLFVLFCLNHRNQISGRKHGPFLMSWVTAGHHKIQSEAGVFKNGKSMKILLSAKQPTLVKPHFQSQ